jgi:RNA polymerase sigma-70 factor (ECF subfamily)
VPQHHEDLALVARMLAGDEGAYDSFAERYSKALFRFVRARLGGDHDRVKEIVQTAMTKALSKMATYRGEASLLTWLCSCCRNEILMLHRRQRSAPEEIELEEDMSPVQFPSFRGWDPESDLLGREEAHLVHMALDVLPPHYAQALEWKYLEQLPVSEIALRLALQIKAAESLLTRARRAFRDAFENLLTAPSARAVGKNSEGRSRERLHANT